MGTARVTAAFGDMGISVMNGMITSIAASIPLFFCQLSFFAKFGTFLCLTIAFSWVFANFVFMSALAQFKIPIKKGSANKPKDMSSTNGAHSDSESGDETKEPKRLGVGATVSFQCKFIHPHRHRDAKFPNLEQAQQLTGAI